jgi:putative colanic acid biosynthesis acetyltransferase WcaF
MIQDLALFKMPDNFRGKPGWYVQLWWITEKLVFNTSPQFMYGWRRFLLRLFGATIGKNVIVRPSVHTQFPWKLKIGNNSWIGDNVTLYNLGNITIGENVVVSQKSYLCTGTHDYRQPNFPILKMDIVINDEAWIGTDVYIAPGVEIESGCIVGARSSVYKSLPGNKVCLGNPAVPVRDRSPR